MAKVYKAIKDTARKGDPEYDAVIIPFEGSNKLRYHFSNPNLHGIDRLPSRLYFVANFAYIGTYDVPFTDSGLVVFSKKIIQIIKGFGDFDFLEVPIIMLDDTFLEKRFDDNGCLNEKSPKNEDYAALRFSELKNYFDYENSEYRVPSVNLNGDGAVGITKFVLSEPKEGFPSLFRTKQKASVILVREDLKKALEDNDVKGYVFEEVEVTPYAD